MLTTEQAAKVLGLAAITLENWRKQGRGPVYMRLGDRRHGMIRYLGADILDYVAASRVAPRATAMTTAA